MIAFVRGEVLELGDDFIVVFCDTGVGYKIYLSSSSSLWDGLDRGVKLSLYVSHVFTESDQRLYGFATSLEQSMFELLRSVSGVGPKHASEILGHLSPEDLINMIVDEDVARIVSVPGIGRKIATRLVIELRDKIVGKGWGPKAGAVRSAMSVEEREFLIEALQKLGFSVTEARELIERNSEALRGIDSAERALAVILGSQAREQ